VTAVEFPSRCQFGLTEIAEAAHELQGEIDRGERIVVGVNDYTEGEDAGPEILRIDPALERNRSAGSEPCARAATGGLSRPRSPPSARQRRPTRT
jgi:methylmalonyl-CoA mutase N-terminal domain/subunit